MKKRQFLGTKAPRKNRKGNTSYKKPQGGFERKTESIFVVNKLDLDKSLKITNPVSMGSLRNTHKILTIGGEGI